MAYDINLVSVFLYSIILFSIIKGALNRFSGADMFHTISGALNNLLLIVAIAMSIYFTRVLFMSQNSNYAQLWVYDVLPESISSYLQDAGIITYVIVVPMFTILLFPLLALVKHLLDNIIEAFSISFCKAVSKTNRLAKAVLGILFEVPGAVLKIGAVVLILGFLATSYPVNAVSQYASESRVYNYINDNAVSKVLSSDIGKKVPVFLWQSVKEITKGVENSKILNKSGSVQTLGLLRFQYETRSNEEIDKTAKKIVGSTTDDKEKAFRLYKWIGKNVSYDWEKYRSIINKNVQGQNFGAVPAFETRKGVCEDYSDLYVAMARAVGLKVRIIVGQGYSQNNWGGHAWNEVYLSNEDKWIPLDTTWENAGNYFNNKDFYDDHRVEAIAGEW